MFQQKCSINVNKQKYRVTYNQPSKYKKSGQSFYILTVFILSFYEITLSFICHSALYMALF